MMFSKDKMYCVTACHRECHCSFMKNLKTGLYTENNYLRLVIVQSAGEEVNVIFWLKHLPSCLNMVPSS